MLWVDPRRAIRLVRQLVRSAGLEERVVGIEHPPRQYLEALARNAPCIDTLLVVEPDAELAVLDLLACLALEVLEAVLEDTLTPHVELERPVMFPAMGSAVKLLIEVIPLVVEIKNARIVDEQRE